MGAANELSGWREELLESARVGHLGLLDDRGHPRVLPVAFALASGALWTAVDHKPKRRPGEELARVRYLRERPQAALTVDRYDDDWSRLAWVQVLGTVSVHQIDAEPGATAALAAKYAQYARRTPPGPMLRLEPERVLSWRASD